MMKQLVEIEDECRQVNVLYTLSCYSFVYKGLQLLKARKKINSPTESKLSALADKLAVLNFFQSELSPLADKLDRIFAL